MNPKASGKQKGFSPSAAAAVIPWKPHTPNVCVFLLKRLSAAIESSLFRHSFVSFLSGVSND